MRIEQYLFYFIMQKVIEKSLRVTILQQISKLNVGNAEFYALLKKLNSNQHMLNETFIDKLQSMKVQIRNKIKQVATNIDLMYQVFDRKICILIQKVETSFNQSKLEEELNLTQIRLKQVEEQLTEVKNKYNLVLSQNQFIKKKNIALADELDHLSRKKAPTLTNDSSRNLNPKNQSIEDYENSDHYLSPLHNHTKPQCTNNDLTFNKNLTINGINGANLTNKKIKSEENSFSSMLIRQQNSFQPSYGTNGNKTGIKKESHKLSFGCIPVRQKIDRLIGQGPLQQQLKRKKLKQSEAVRDESHRLSFLINNLKDNDQTSFVSSGSSQYDFSRDQSANKSGISKGGAKKYHI